MTSAPLPPPALRTLDVLMFSGNDMYPSRAIEFLTRSRFSHIAIALDAPTYIDKSLASGSYVLESGEEVRPCAVGGEMAWGVQIQSWPFIRETYPGRILCRRFVWRDRDGDGDSENATLLHERLAAAWEGTRHAGYDMNPVDFVRADTHLTLEGSCQKTSEFVCSAYATYILTKCNALAPDTKWDTFLPRDFIPGGRIDEALSQHGTAHLSSTLTVLKK